MKFVNESRWEDDDVRALIEAGAADYGVSLQKVTVTVETWRGRNGMSSASASRKGTGFTLKLARPERLPPVDAVTALANIGHGRPERTVFGSQLSDVCNSIVWALRYTSGRGKHTNRHDLPAWAATLFLRPKPPEVKQARVRLTPQEIAARRTKRRESELAESRAKLAKWERKLKLAKTKVKTYAREVKRREKALARKARSPFPGGK